MIKYNNSNINDWYYDTSDIIKVYRNNAVCYYKIVTSGDTPTQVPCFAVVADITQYQDRTYVDVFNKADKKWYKLNNLNQYEEYGVYGSGRTITYYEGKLTIDGSNEYIYSGNSWQDVGEVSGSSRVPASYTEVEYIENTTSAYINTGVYLYDSTTNSYTIQCKHYFQPYGSDFEYLFGTEGTSSPYVGVNFRYYKRNLQYNSSPSNVTWTHINNGDGTSGITASCSPTNATNGNNPLTLFCGLWSTGPWRFGRGKIYSFTVTKNSSIVRDLVPCKRDSDSMVGMYDLVNDEFYYPPNYTSYQLVAGAATGTTTYPLYYDEKSAPPNNLTFSSMTEAEEYECPWVGMQATIDGVTYIFSGDSQSGYEWVESVDFQKQYLTFVATESGTFKLNGNSIDYSLDSGSTWTTLASNTNSPTVSAGSNIMFKATLTPSSNGIGKFSSTANFTVEGNPMSLLYGDNFIGQTDLTGKDNAFNSLFSGCTTITSAENVSLPATILSTSCYQYMFLDCSNLSVAPSVLSATSLADNCYNGMFGNCTSLTTAPKMLATTLVKRCCQYMYINCSSLNSVTCIATNPSTSYTTSWLSGVASNGTFIKAQGVSWLSGASGIPSNWTVQDYQG